MFTIKTKRAISISVDLICILLILLGHLMGDAPSCRDGSVKSIIILLIINIFCIFSLYTS